MPDGLGCFILMREKRKFTWRSQPRGNGRRIAHDFQVAKSLVSGTRMVRKDNQAATQNAHPPPVIISRSGMSFLHPAFPKPQMLSDALNGQLAIVG